jgi:two-component system, OmpR family, sensor histidine kinase KdpD
MQVSYSTGSIRRRRPWALRVLRMIVAAIVLSAISSLYHSIEANTATASLTFLLLVLGAAAYWGFLEALFASVWCMILLNYHFLPPLYSMGIDDPQNWVAWVAFLVTSVMGSNLATQLKRRVAEAARRQNEIERLYDLSCYLMLDDTHTGLAKRIPEHVARVVGCAGVAFYERASGVVFRAGTPDRIPQEALIRLTGSLELWNDPDGEAAVVPVNLGATALGSLGFQGAAISGTSMQAIANLVALGLDRAQKQQMAAQGEAARRHQELKSMLLDALAHEFQTPLTSMRVAVDAALAEPPGAEQREWLEIVDEESTRLRSLMTEAIQMARIEAGHVDLDKQTHTLDDLLHSALKRELTEPGQVEIDLPSGLPAVSVDAGMIRLALRQIVGNALKYSGPGAPIEVRVRTSDNSVEISISDEGPGIPVEEQPFIFEKFYRGRQGHSSQSGMGMGLPIVRQVVEAHGGQVWVDSRPGEGATFSFTLPFAQEEANA